MSHHGLRRRAATVFAVAACATGALGGCAGGTTGVPSSATSPTTAVDTCAVAVARIVGAVRDVVAGYSLPVGPVGPVGPTSPSTAATSTPSTSPATDAPASSSLEGALAAARDAVQRDGCDRGRFVDSLGRGLREVPARGAIAAAVLARLTATITGQVAATPVTREVATADQLRAALAEAPAGSTVRLAAGEIRLDDPLVILDGVTLVGAGQAATTLRTAAPDAGVLVLSTGRVELSGLTLARVPGTTGSGILTGTSVALVLTGVTVSGSRPSGASTGGAGVHLSAQSGDPAPGRTTLEVTGSTFADNAWAGIVVGGAHRVSIERSTFRGNGECGVCFLGSSDGSVSASEFAGNAVGLAAVGTSHPVVVDVTVTGGTVGVQADDTAAPTMQGVRVSGTSRAAFIFAGSSSGVLEDATCTKVPVGIGVGPQAAPTLTRTGTCSLAGG